VYAHTFRLLFDDKISMASRLSFMDLSVDLKTLIVQHVSIAGFSIWRQQAALEQHLERSLERELT
jgi:hypothetical protein